ncbi:MAG: aminoacetone oxidase family FAD-binding enzyme [Thermodesulfobacteriota bacterium]
MRATDHKRPYDVIIIGAGAAGLLAAGFCGRGAPAVLLLEGKDKPGRKLLITGGGRCNISHATVDYRDFNCRHPRTVKHILAAFSASKTMDFFQRIGVTTRADAGGNLFPVTQSAATVLESLLRQLPKNVDLRTASKVREIHAEKKIFRIVCDQAHYFGRSVLLCPGGSSHPRTGSDGSGFALAGALGHTIVPPTPALTPLLTDDADWKSLAGITLPCRLWLEDDAGRQLRAEGPLLFTHKGYSGPCALNISRHWIHNRNRWVRVNFLPGESAAAIKESILQTAREHPRQTLKTWLAERLPGRLAQVLLEKSGLGNSPVLGQLAKHQRDACILQLLECPLPVSGAMGFGKAEVTAGGVDLAEVTPNTLESRIVPGLFFAGEVLDVDGPIGGYNLQWAWSSAFAAAQGTLRFLSRT